MRTHLSLIGTLGVLVAGYAALFYGEPRPESAVTPVGPLALDGSTTAVRPPFSALRTPAMAQTREQDDVEAAARSVVAAIVATEQAFDDADAARAETASVEAVVRISRGGLPADLARALGWPADGWQAQALGGWLEQRTTALATWTETRDNDAFDDASDALAEELIVTFGRPAAERLAPRLGLRRTDPATGGLLAVDLDGKPLQPQPDAD